MSPSNLKLHNTYPIHKHSNTLEIRITHMLSNFIFSHSFGPYITDHKIILITLQSHKPSNPIIIHSSRKIKIINTHNFIIYFIPFSNNSSNELFTSILTTLATHAPIIIKKYILRFYTSYYTLTYINKNENCVLLTKIWIKPNQIL